MTHPLLVAIRVIGRQAYLRLWAAAALRWLTVLCVALLGAGVLDWFWRSNSPAERWALSGLWAIVPVVYGYLSASRLLSARRDPVSVARWLERIDPRWGDRLSSATEFLLWPDAEERHVSAQLRQRLIQEVGQSLPQLVPARYLVWRPLRRAALALAVVLVAGAVLGAAAPQQASLALRRVLMPWRAEPWPRRHVLEFVDLPAKLAEGDDLEIQVVDRQGRLPDAVTLHYRWLDEPAIESFPMTFAGGRMVYRIANVTRSLELRVTGGDDHQMPWHTVQIVPPPKVTENRIQVVPPSSSGYAPYQLNGSGTVLAGSTLAWQGRFEPLPAQVWLVAEPDELCRWPDGSQSPHEAESLADNAVWQLRPVQAVGAGRLRFGWRLRHEDGWEWQSPGWTLQVLEDRPPSVAIQPLARLSTVTRRARLPVRGRAEDDLGLRSVAIRITAGSVQKSWEVYSASEPPPRMGVPPQQPDARPWETVLDLVEIGIDPSADVLAIAAVAEDFAGQQQSSETVVLELLDDQQYLERFLQLQAQLIPLLQQLVEWQQTARRQAELLYEQHQQARPWDAAQVDRWNSVELQQRRIARMLLSDPESLRARVEQLHQEMVVNRVEVPDVISTLRRLEGSLADLQQFVPAAEAAVAEVSRQLPEPPEYRPKGDSALAEAMYRALQEQGKILQILEQLLAMLSDWEGYRQFADKVGELLAVQRQLIEQTLVWQQRLLGRNTAELSAAEQAELARLAEQQDDLRRRFEQLQQAMSAAVEPLSRNNPQAGQGVERAVEEARRSGIASWMRSATGDIQQNRVGRAATAEQQAARGLQKMAEALVDQPTEALADRLQQAAGDVRHLRTRQGELDRLRQAAAQRGDGAQAQRLSEAQQQLAQQARDLANQLQALHPGAAEAVEDAAESMDQLRHALQEQRWPEADRASDKVHRSLEEAAGQLESAGDATRKEALAKQWGELQQKLDDWQQRESLLARRTTELDQKYQQQTVWSAEQRALLDAMSEEQYQLAVQLRQSAGQWRDLVIVGFELQTIAELMESASAGLGRYEAGASTQRDQRWALERLERLERLLKQTPPSAKSAPAATSQPQDAQQLSGNVPAISVQELMLLEEIQAELQQRTARLEEERLNASRQPPAEWHEAARRLAQEQAALARLLEQLTQAGSEEQMP
ncbi:MAG: hypothetical protein KatS3mg110_2347 [Pirellulaceae bacterium]|nr:MAG: hypothetical protein KatS3mg110_2347 [Pirellulaceae bacterium]